MIKESVKIEQPFTHVSALFSFLPQSVWLGGELGAGWGGVFLKSKAIHLDQPEKMIL
jgi:hypothetical protein